MSKRRQSLGSSKILAYAGAGLLHVIVIGALVVNFTLLDDEEEGAIADKVDIVKATTVDESQVQKQVDRIKQEDQKKREDEINRQEELQRLQDEAKVEERRIEKLKKDQQREREKAKELERKAIALKKKQEDAERERVKKVKAEKERKRRAEIARKKKEEEDKRRQLEESLAAEEAFIAEQKANERATTMMAKYQGLIQNKVRQHRIDSPDFQPWMKTLFNVRLSKYGEVKAVRVLDSSGDERYDHAVETAIFKASPLPIPDVDEDPEVNALFQNLNLNFNMSDG